MVEGHLDEDKIMFVDVGWGFGFGNEDLGYVRECFYEAFSSFVLAEFFVGFASDDKSFNATTHCITITGHFCGKVLIHMEL